MQSESEQMRGRIQQARGSLIEMRGRADRWLGQARSNTGRWLPRFQWRADTGFLGGITAFIVAAGAAVLLLFPGARMALWDTVGRYTGRARPERPIDRFWHWTRRTIGGLGINW